MKNPLGYYAVLAKRWAWMILLGIVFCSGATFAVSKVMRPVYQASATLILSMGTSTSAYDNFNTSVQAAQTYAQLLTSSTVLNAVAVNHHGLTASQLKAMITVKPQPNTQLIELDVENHDPLLAMQLANEISQSFVQFSDSQLSGNIQVLPAQQPTAPIRPNVLVNTGIGALIGLGLAVALIVIFEWFDDRLISPDEVQEILGLETLTTIPEMSRKERSKNAEKTPALAEGCRILCATLNAAQAIKPFKGIMVTSALADEGKTSIAVNLASFLAMAGKRVLLVDADLRRPMLHHHFQLDNHHGLTHAFIEKWAQLELELNDQPTDIPTLRLLTAGVILHNPAELLQSSLAREFFSFFQKMPEYDYVIFDTPPLLPVADAQILSSYIQTAVLVVDGSKTPRKALLRARQVLNKTNTSVLGVVLNKSLWPDYGGTRQYLSGARRHKTSDNLAMPSRLPHTPIVDDWDSLSFSEASPSEDEVDQNVTITVPRRQKGNSENS